MLPYDPSVHGEKTFEWEPPSWPDNGGCFSLAVVILAIFGDRVAIPVLNHERFSFWFVPLCAAWAASSFGLLAVWLGFSGKRLSIRLLTAGFLCTVLALVLEPRSFGEIFATLTLLVLAIAVPFGVLRLFGFELKVQIQVRPAARGRSGLRRSQFSLKQLLGWSLATSLVASLARFMKLSWRDSLDFAVIGAMISLVSLAATCTILIDRKNRTVALLMIPLCAFAALLNCGAFVLLNGAEVLHGQRMDQLFGLVIASLCQVFLMAGVLLGYRALNYRIVRRSIDS